jgi:hypothetical protein
MILRRAWPLEPAALQALVADPSASLPDRTNPIPDWLRRGEGEKRTLSHSVSDIADDLPIGFRCANRFDRLSHSLDASLRIHESAVLLERGSYRQENGATLFCGLIQEHVLDNDQIEALQSAARGVGIDVSGGLLSFIRFTAQCAPSVSVNFIQSTVPYCWLPDGKLQTLASQPQC